MMKWPELNRHVVGIPALAALLVGLGVFANWHGGGQRSPMLAGLENGTARGALDRVMASDNNALTEHRSATSEFGGSPMQKGQADQQATRSEANGQQSQGANSLQREDATQSVATAQRHEGATTQPSSSAAGALATAASAWKNWSDDDWRIAIQAVEQHRASVTQGMTQGPGGQGAQANSGGQAIEHRSASEPIKWKPPAEIAGKTGEGQ